MRVLSGFESRAGTSRQFVSRRLRHVRRISTNVYHVRWSLMVSLASLGRQKN